MDEKLNLLQTIASNFIVAPQPPSHTLQGFEGVKEWNLKHGIVFGNRFSRDGISKGFNDAGRTAFIKLVNVLRVEHPSFMNAMKFSDFGEMLVDLVMLQFEEKLDQELTENSWNELSDAIHRKINDLTIERTFYVPCSIIPYPASSFHVGPVSFVHIESFKKNLVNEADGNLSFLAPEFINFMEQRRAYWVAELKVKGQDQKLSEEKANLAVDVALTTLQLMFPLDESRYMARATGRTLPPHVCSLHKENHSFGFASREQEAGVSLHGSYMDHLLSKRVAILESVGARVNRYLNEGSKLPNLNLSWCDAAFWYHEGIAEPLDTVAITKLETSVEALVRAENTRGSSTRFRQCFKIFMGYEEEQKLSIGMSVKELVSLLVGARSQVLHGTLSTILRNNREIGDRQIRPILESICHDFLFKFTILLDDYEKQTESEDNIDSFFDWIERFIHRSPPPYKIGSIHGGVS